jgi:uncharacterized RDD family membrane protein YckC
MKHTPMENAITVALIVCLALVSIVFGLAVWLGLTWIICLVVGGFGWEIPFWPTFGAIFLVTLLVNWLRPSRRS